jgi:adenosine deaminase
VGDPTVTGSGTQPSAASLRLAQAMPKAELHLHLDGSVLPGTALDLARSRRVDGPTSLDGMRAVLMAPRHGASQAELLRTFDLPIALLQDAEALERVTRELVEVKAADNVRYVEIRWGPLLHTTRGMSLAEGIAAVASGAAAGEEKTGATVRLIATAIRSHSPEANEEMAGVAATFRDRGVVAFDLAGPEEAFPDPLLHVHAFEIAREAGLRITVHASEWGGAAQVRRVLSLRPERIAHGPGAADDPALCDELVARGITLDLAPTSNVQAGIVASRAAHPLAMLHRRGVPVTLSTDDLTVSDISLSEEYAFAIDEIGLTSDELWDIDRHALDVAFAAEEDLLPLRAEFDAWRQSARAASE